MCPAYRRTVPVHPHTRGEILAGSPLPQAHGGSPPHAWGDWRQENPDRLCLRFTPTRVGRLWGFVYGPLWAFGGLRERRIVRNPDGTGRTEPL